MLRGGEKGNKDCLTDTKRDVFNIVRMLFNTQYITQYISEDKVLKNKPLLEEETKL